MEVVNQLLTTQMDPRVARVPIALSKDDADRDPVVRWIRSEFSKLDEVPTPAAYPTWSDKHIAEQGADISPRF